MTKMKNVNQFWATKTLSEQKRKQQQQQQQQNNPKDKSFRTFKVRHIRDLNPYQYQVGQWMNSLHKPVNKKMLAKKTSASFCYCATGKSVANIK